MLDNLCAKGVLECSKVNKSIDLYSSIPLKNEPILLTEEQQAAYDALLPGWRMQPRTRPCSMA